MVARQAPRTERNYPVAAAGINVLIVIAKTLSLGPSQPVRRHRASDPSRVA